MPQFARPFAGSSGVSFVDAKSSYDENFDSMWSPLKSDECETEEEAFRCPDRFPPIFMYAQNPDARRQTRPVFAE